MAELKPCPFCGGSDIRIEKIYDYYEVLCCDCLSRTEEYSTNEEAIEAWNNRPSPWHTGTPTEEGLYVVFNEHLCYDIVEVKPWTTLHGVVAYQKIEPYKEANYGTDN